MIFQRLYKLFTIWLFVIFVSACKPEPAVVNPKLEFSHPSLASVIRPPDTIRVAGTVSYVGAFDIEFTLLNVDFVPVAQTVKVRVSGPESSFDYNYEVLSTNLSSGDYYIRAKVADFNFYRAISLIQPDVQKLGYAILADAGNNQISAYWFSNGTLEQKRILNSDFSGSAVKSEGSILAITGDFMSGMRVYSLPEFTDLWSVPKETGTGLPDFSTVFYGNGYFFAGRRDGRVNGFSDEGVEVFDVQTFSQHYATDGVVSQGLLYMAIHPMPGTSPGIQLGVANANNGFGIQQAHIGYPVRALEVMNPQRVYAFWNENNTGVFESYNYSQNGFESFFTLPPQNVMDACRVDGNRVIVALEDGVYLHDYSSNNFGRIAEVNSPQDVEYDFVTGEIAVVVGTEVRVFGLNGQFRYAIPVNDSIFAIHNVYSR